MTKRMQAGARGKRADSEKERRSRRRLWQLTVAGAIFVTLVAVKLFFPQSVAEVAATVREQLRRQADFKAAFSAVGEAIAGERGVGESMKDAYTAVFAPDKYHAEKTRAAWAAAAQIEEPAQRLARHLESVTQRSRTDTAIQTAEKQEAAAQSLLHFGSEVPDNVSYAFCALGFAYATPVQGTVTSTFGLRMHPIYGEQRFHHGLDIAAAKGTAICAFADGTVKAVGESSSLGRYLMIDHPNGFSTLYAHCDRVVVSTGRAVKLGEKVAEMGDTGLVTGTHLHFSLLQGDTYLNPAYYVEVS